MQMLSVIEERPTKHLWEGHATGIHPRKQPIEKENGAFWKNSDIHDFFQKTTSISFTERKEGNL